MKKIKFSFVVPVYNMEKLLKRCLDSIFNQTYDNYEVIIVNDGSTDNSLDIIKSYKEKIILIDQKNQGLSMARNNGVKKVTGDYIIFVDSDDCINQDLLKTLNKKINDEDLVRYQIKNINNEAKIDYHEKEFTNLTGSEAFKIITESHYVEMATSYAYKTKYYLKNKFMFTKGTYHEDFGLIPEIIIKAGSVSAIDFIGYNYYYTEGSIMNNNEYSKVIKKANDMMIHYDRLINVSDDPYFKSFISNSILIKSNTLKGEEYKAYYKQIKDKHIIDNLLDDTFKRKIKKLLLKVFPRIFIRGMK